MNVALTPRERMHDSNSQTAGVVVDNLIRGHCRFGQTANERLLLKGIASYDRWIEATGKIRSRVLIIGSTEDAGRVVANQW